VELRYAEPSRTDTLTSLKPTMLWRPVKFALTAAVLTLAACSGGGITPAERYQVAFLDGDGVGKVKVRWSDDGITWQSGDVPDNQTGSAGPAMAASPDGIGATTVLLYNNILGKMRLKFGVGPNFATDSVDLDRQSGSEQSLVSVGSDIYFIGGAFVFNSAAPRIFRYNHITREITDVTPAGGVDGMVRVPSLIYVPALNRIVAAWHDNGGFKVASGTLNAQRQVSWTSPISIPDPPPEYEEFLPVPALATDGRRIQIGVLRQVRSQFPSPNGQFLLFRFVSEDGVNWSELGRRIALDALGSTNWVLQMAMTSRCGLLVVMVSTDSPANPTDVYLRDNNGFEHFPSGSDVFGEPTHKRNFALIRRGFAPPSVTNDCQ